jgi:glyoxalase family protein
VEPLRAKLEAELTPIVNPRPRSKKKARKTEPSANGVPSEPATVA